MASYTLDDFEPLIPADELQKRVADLGAEISKDIDDPANTVVVCVLKGAVVFMVDLIRHLPSGVTCDFLRVSSYEGGTESTGTVRWEFDLTQPIAGKDVLIVEDIIDTGLTATFLMKALSVREPRSISMCTLLHKPSRAKEQVEIKYLGFTIENRFVIGYGLDLDGMYRNLDHVAALKPELAGE